MRHLIGAGNPASVVYGQRATYSKFEIIFSYNSTYGVVVHSCVIPGPTSQERHRRAEPHRLLGGVLKSTVQQLSSYDLRTVEELKAHKPRPEDKCEKIQQLSSYEEEALFIKLEEDYQDVKGDIEEQASIVHDFADSRSERVPWLERVEFPSHTATLKDEEVWSSYKLLPKKEVDGGAEGATDPNLVRILAAAEAMLRDAYKLCSDTSPDRKMTQQRANILNEFYAGASGKADGFRHFKNPGHVLHYYEAALGVLLPRGALKVRGKGRGLWEEPGNFNSHLSALTWVAQLVIFDFACFHEQDDEDQIPVFLARMCRKFFQQLAETPFGHILQWRLYLLFKVGKAAIAKHQARWSLDGQTVEYRGVELQMTQVSQLVLSEYQKAHSLLWDELLFGAKDLIPMESWRLKDDLDLEDFGGSWLSHPSNSEFLDGAELALFRRIQGNAKLRAMFLTTAADGSVILCPKAMKIYEAHAQDFLKPVLVLAHVAPGPPLRASELLSVMWRNTARQRHMLMWEELVMLYVQYHKGQQQSGVYKDNIRFLPKAIGDLLLMYIAYVIPLRQMFLRQQTPGALISPYLWSKLDGIVWADDTLAACLAKACTCAQVPRFKTARWRQFAASITKEKFAAKERANFDMEDNLGAGSCCPGRAEQSQLPHLQPRIRGDDDAHDECPTASELPCFRQLAPEMKLRVPGQRDGLLAMMGLHPAEQILLVMGTGPGKSLVFMVGASVADARTTMLVLPMVALRGDMLDRCRRVGIQPLIWSIERRDSASLVIMSAEAVCTESFLEYAHLLVNRQQLDRIVIDECHLTITANDYRKCMSQVGWYVRQVKTQTVWLTATLPPTMQDDLIEHNKLVRPRIIRESTNRPNLKYMISRHTGATTLVEVAAKLVQTYWPRKQIFNHARDKIIIYCHIR
ncbi:hypothetical protein O988_04874 [Pseudogymnoascus sp. VKM F-3808]|nr:hypothetical protein O988_04874 [Pseudogymnoascus sp. VKM F-3808]